MVVGEGAVTFVAVAGGVTVAEAEVLAPLVDILTVVGFFEPSEELILGDVTEFIVAFAGVGRFREVFLKIEVELHGVFFIKKKKLEIKEKKLVKRIVSLIIVVFVMMCWSGETLLSRLFDDAHF